MKDQAYKLRQKMLLDSTTPAKTIGIVSGKGGVGKSNISTNLSILLGKADKKVMLFDMDIGMGNIHLLLGTHHKYSIMDYIENEELELQDVICSNVHGISYIGGGNGLKSIVEWKEDQLERFYEALDYLVLEYDYIIFDMGAGATRETLDLLLTMEDILVVTTPEPTSITDAYSMMKYIHLRDDGKEFYLICNRAINKHEGMVTISRLQETVRRFLNKEIVSLGVLPEDPVVRRAVSEQTPLIKAFPRSPISLSLQAISSSFLLQSEKLKHQEEKSSFLKNIRNLFFRR
ncbi:MinD/ParA family protein [Rossellomorea aquimaris]|uniref:MinD/ParA family protein n=1 Tax=Rossellomorea aquimaris TaxID=189382 RepID=UPI001CD312BB|nr:MinD/ParA family protein [Rossellomorea aquimaris]MCA1053530.1 MinD/ParA family protein [Rossellomorea aquimaris]